MTNNDPTSNFPDDHSRGIPFSRSSTDSWIAGVCGGIAAATGWDVSLIRALAVGAAIVSFGTAVLLYLAAAMLLPKDRP